MKIVIYILMLGISLAACSKPEEKMPDLSRPIRSSYTPENGSLAASPKYIQDEVAKIAARVTDKPENILQITDTVIKRMNDQKLPVDAYITRDAFLRAALSCLDEIDKRPDMQAAYKKQFGRAAFIDVSIYCIEPQIRKPIARPTPTVQVPSATTKAVPAPSVQAISSPEPTVVATFSDGSHIVGSDVMPGTYRAMANSESACYWERVRGFSGEGDDLIANGLREKGAVIVTIKASDKGFNSQSCGTWTKIK